MSAGHDSETFSTLVTRKSLPMLLEADAPVPLAFELPAFPAMEPAALFWVSALEDPEVPVRSLLAEVLLLGFEADAEVAALSSVPCTRTCLPTFEDRSWELPVR